MISKILKINLIQFIYYNYLCKNVIRKKNCRIYPEKHSCIQLSKESKLILDGNLHFNANRYKGSKAEAYLRLNGAGVLHIKGETKIRFGSTIQVNDGGELEMGRFTCNANINIQCAKKIVVGDDCMFGRNVMVYDSSYHPTGTNMNNLKITIMPVKIGNHVWIGTNAVILQGSTINDGCIIGTNASISGKIAKNSLVLPKIDKDCIPGKMWARSMDRKEEALAYAPVVAKDIEKIRNRDRGIER